MRPVIAVLAAVLPISLLVAGPSYGEGLPGPDGALTTPGYPLLGVPPAGANDWGCRPSAQRPDPAVIVHGTFGDQKSLLDNLSLALKRDGYCVYSLDYGNRGTGRIQRSARQLRRFVGRVLAATGASKVEMVGHSQGGMMPRYYIEHLGGARHVEDLVGLAPSNHGTHVNDAFSSGGLCRACDQQRAGSVFLRRLNHPDETPGPVDYTQIETEDDEVVVPYTSAFLHPGPHSVNILLQDRCPLDHVDHLFIPMDPQAIAWVLDAFDRPGPADPSAPIGCRGRM
jgi:triacylglycerol esterase/lipase EstA (alpha/beta hydrolase family)